MLATRPSELARRVAGALLATIALAVPATATAAPLHEAIAGSYTVDDFCGTGKSVDVTFSGTQTLSIEETVERFTIEIKYWVTNPENGLVVREHGAGQSVLRFVPGEDGGEIVVVSSRGILEQLKPVQGGLLTTDVGLLTLRHGFDADGEYIGTEVVVRGPHPELDSDFTLYCETMTEALGL